MQPEGVSLWCCRSACGTVEHLAAAEVHLVRVVVLQVLVFAVVLVLLLVAAAASHHSSPSSKVGAVQV
jgi:hypothetical protein